ncbi:plasmid pRiA4b ORF-3 family protein [Pseudogracilibacillus auburnensis]|uniref:plasmid pRiA4b ORF-3 family protein n=1 Tax=Pseudogracilibacillus auburnensis TaxID=1494959 RepID=UPI001A95F638|nr:plasmid pRiA4b ORF-3 family protein [Pseudogracilibacillus auburnensis]MBO1005898.1 plasmid pRiA4b ORF-3 family protein [Pseudogracilibacillus auburnensis]
MLIHCTKKLLDELKIKPEPQEEQDDFFSWHANLITMNRRKTVLVMNNKNRYVVVLHGLNARDFERLDQLIIQAIRESFLHEGIKEEIIEQYVQSAGELIFTKTKDRTSIARLNRSCEEVFIFADLLDASSVINTDVSLKASRLLVGLGKKYVKPNEEMYKDLETCFGKEIFSVKAVELKVTLDLENHHVWRKIIVPVNMTFDRLHEVLQEVFGWKESHLHEFYIYGQEKEGDQPAHSFGPVHKEGYRAVANLVSHKEAFNFENDLPMILDREVKLEYYIPSKIKYIYDFGDDWQHYIEVEKNIDDYDKNYPQCTGAEGIAPPEDVGGEGGFEEFLKVIVDEDNPDHARMKSWGKSQGYKKFDLEAVNRRLRYL